MKGPVSMTSFGRGECSENGRVWTVEVRSVNHRFCDINIKIPRSYAALEEKIRKTVNEYYSRGRVEVSLNYKGDADNSTTIEANIPLARQYRNCLIEIKRMTGVGGEIDLALIAGLRDVITPVEREENLDEIWNSINTALTEALKEGLKMRQAEGASLKKELTNLLKGINEEIDGIEQEIPQLIAKKQENLQERLDNLLKGVDIDPVRLAQEAAIIVDKTDITEEIGRLRSHVEQFLNFLKQSEPVGRRLDFLSQEFLREINTIASKIGDADTAHKTVRLKNDIEKMREQVQNIE